MSKSKYPNLGVLWRVVARDSYEIPPYPRTPEGNDILEAQAIIVVNMEAEEQEQFLIGEETEQRELAIKYHLEELDKWLDAHIEGGRGYLVTN